MSRARVGAMTRRHLQILGGVALAVAALASLAASFWTAPVIISANGLSVAVPALIGQGIVGAIAAVVAGRLLGRAFPRRPE